MRDFWETRYASAEFVYGTEPNHFLSRQLSKLKGGKILLPAEGEGRNAVFAANSGFEVNAFDYSPTAREKAIKLANDMNVSINYDLATYESAKYPENYFDVVAFVFAHMPPGKRQEWHRKFMKNVKPGGYIILQGFSKEQLEYNTGGPANIDMLFSEDEIAEDFNGMKKLLLTKETVHLDEGIYHRGRASVVNGVFVNE